MRDPRFTARSTFWRDLVSQAQLVADEMWGVPLVDVLCLVLRESRFLENHQKFSPLTSRLADYLTCLGADGITIPEEIVNALNSSIDSQADGLIPRKQRGVGD